MMGIWDESQDEYTTKYSAFCFCQYPVMQNSVLNLFSGGLKIKNTGDGLSNCK